MRALRNKSKSEVFISKERVHTVMQPTNQRIKPISQDKQPTFLRVCSLLKWFFIYFHYNFFFLLCSCLLLDSLTFISNPFQLFLSSSTFSTHFFLLLLPFCGVCLLILRVVVWLYCAWESFKQPENAAYFLQLSAAYHFLCVVFDMYQRREN